MPSSFKNDDNVFQSEVVAEVFNDYFVNVAENLQSRIDNMSPINLLKSASHTFSMYVNNPCD
jgi:hypothetical protein